MTICRNSLVRIYSFEGGNMSNWEDLVFKNDNTDSRPITTIEESQEKGERMVLERRAFYVLFGDCRTYQQAEAVLKSFWFTTLKTGGCS